MNNLKMNRKNQRTILFLSKGLNIINSKTGTENRIHNLLIQASKRNEVIALTYEEYLEESEREFSFRTYSFKVLRTPNLIDFNISFFLVFLNILRNEEIDVICVPGPSGIITAKILCKFLKLNIPIIYDAQKVEGDVAKVFPNPSLPLIKRLVVPYFIPLLERFATKFANHVTSVSGIDKSRFVEKYNLRPSIVSVVPSGVNMRKLSLLSDNNDMEKKLGVESEIKIVFHGLYSYYPNKEAVDLMVDYIAPEIYKKHKNSVFLIAGKDMPLFEKENVKSVGFVDDIYSFLDIADIAIAPLLNGGGTKLKILDYMGAGLPIVTTKKGIEGIDAKNGEHAIIVDNVNEEFINAMEYLIENEHERKRLGRNARKLAEEKYDWDKIGEKLNTLYFDLIRERMEG